MRRTVFLAVLILSSAFGARAQAPNTISTVAGGGANATTATSAYLPGPFGIARDITNHVTYLSISALSIVYKVDSSGNMTPYAGNGILGFSGDGKAATSAQLDSPSGLAVDGGGNLFIADSQNNRIRKVDTSGIITTVAGSGNQYSGLGFFGGYSGDGGPATSALMNFPTAVAVDGGGNLFIADSNNSVIRKVDNSPTHIITTYAGGAAAICAGATDAIGDGCPATSAQLNFPEGMAVDSTGNVFIADFGNSVVRIVNTAATPVINAYAGSVATAFTFGGDGGPANQAGLNAPQGVAVDSSGSLYIADTFNNRIRKVDNTLAHDISTFAGSATRCFTPTGCGDGAAATLASLSVPTAVAVDETTGDIFFADSGVQRYRMVIPGATPAATIINNYSGGGVGGDGSGATLAVIGSPAFVSLDNSGDLFVFDDAGARIRKVNASTQVITNFAGNGAVGAQGGTNGDGGQALQANFTSIIHGMALDASGNLYVIDRGNFVVRRVDTAGNITLFAGTHGKRCPNAQLPGCGDTGSPTSATLRGPTGLTVDSNGNVYIVDGALSRVRVVCVNAPCPNSTDPPPFIPTTGTIYNFTGSGTAGSADGPPSTATFNGPWGIAFDATNKLFYIADANNNLIRKIDTLGNVSKYAFNGQPTFGGDGGNALSASMQFPQQVALDSAGNLYVGGGFDNVVRRIDVNDQSVITVAGDVHNLDGGFNGDGGPSTKALISNFGLALFQNTTTKANTLYIADGGNNRVRSVLLAPVAVVNSLLQPFGPVLPGTSSSTGLVTITNNGLDALVLTSGLSVPADFTLVNACPLSPVTLLPTVAPGGSCFLSVALNPAANAAPGPVSGNLTFNTNDPGNPSFSFPVSGLVVALPGVPVSVTVSPLPNGPGAVVFSSPGGISCPSTCSVNFAPGQMVSLTAFPSPTSGLAFTGWTVNSSTTTCPGTGACALTIGTTPLNVTATFGAATVKVSGMGNGLGTITSNPTGINCTSNNGVTSGTCTFSGFPAGTTTVTLTATPDPTSSSTFAGWLGFCSATGINNSGTGPCTINLSLANLPVINGALATAVFSGPPKPFGLGDVFVGTVDGMIFEFKPSAQGGTLVQVLNSGNLGGAIAGMNFDSSGNLFAANFAANTVERFASGTATPTTFGGPYNSAPIGLVIDPGNNVFVGQSSGNNTLLEFSSSGTLTNTFFPAYDQGGIGYLELLDDGARVLYTSSTQTSTTAGSVRNYDIANGHQNPDLATNLPGGPAFAIRELGDKTILVANTTVIVRVDQNGNQQAIYQPIQGGLFFALNVNPDGKSFWAGDALTGNVYQVLVSDGSILNTINTGLGFNSTIFTTVYGIAVFGQPQSGGADLAVTVSAPTTDAVNTQMTYTATVTNSGPLAAAGVSVTDTFPANVTVDSAVSTQGPCSGSPAVTCNIGTMSSPATVTVTFKVTPTQTMTLNNTVTANATTPDPIPGNNSFTTSTTVVGPALATITMAAPSTLELGVALTYQIQATNPGGTTLTGIAVTDTLPGSLNASSLSPGCTGTNSITCTIGTLTAGQIVNLSITIVPTGTGVLGNTADVTGGNSASVSTSVITGGVPLVLEVDSVNPADFITTSPSSGICTTAQSICTVYFPPGTPVTVTANGPGFVGWSVNNASSPACPPASNTCSVTLSSPQQVLAAYSSIGFVTSQLTGVVGFPFGTDLSHGVIGGVTPYTITLTSTLPNGLTFTAPSIFGIPTTAGVTQLTVNITDAIGEKGSTPVTLTIINAPTGQEALMNGNYGIVFHLVDDASGASNGSLFAVAGSLHFNGKGVIDSATLDTNSNTPGKGPQTLSVTGTYSIGADHRCLITLQMVGKSFAFIACSVGDVYQGIAHTAHIIEFDDNTGTGERGAGILKLQDPKAFNANSFAGPYIFAGIGQDSAFARLIEEGLFAVTALGAFGSGSADVNDNGVLASVPSITGTYSEPGLTVPIDPGNGRTQWSLNSGSTSASSYIIDANNVVFITMDPVATSGLVIAGTAERQLNTAPFDATFLSGPVVIAAQGPSNAGKNSNVLIGAGTFTAAAGPNPTTGTLSLTKDKNDSGNVTLEGIENDTYTMAANGRLVVTPASGKLVFGYLSRPNRGYLMGTDASADFGTIDLQTGGPFTVPALPTNYFFGDREPSSTTRGEDVSGVVSLSNNTASATFDQSHEGGRLDYAESASFGISVAPAGRLILTHNPSNLIAPNDEIGQVITPAHLIFSEFDPSQNRPTLHEEQSFLMPAGLPLPNPASVNFPTPVASGSNATMTLTFSNAGDGLLSFTGVTNATDFSVSSGTCVTGLPVVVLAHSTCTGVVTFAPQPGTATGVPLNENLTLQTDAGSVTINASGTVAAATLQSIAVTPANPSIAKGRTQQFTATGTFSDNSTQNLTAQVTWASATPAVATITAGGLATGVSAGTSSISATLTGISGSTVLTVTAGTLQSIAVTPANPSIAKGRTQQFTATGTFSDNSTQNLTNQVTWASATPAVATITAGGLATGAGTGTSSISATLTGISGSTVLTVTAAVLQSITVTPPNPTIAMGLTQQFTATGTFSDNSTQNLTAQVTWASATPAVATINAAGLATAVGTGTSSISATLTGITGSTVLTVTAAGGPTLVSINIFPANPNVPLGQTIPLTAIGNFSDSSQQDLTTASTWSSDTPGVATVSNAVGTQGQVTGVGAGTATISALSAGITGNTVVTVASNPFMNPPQLFFTEPTLGTQTPSQQTAFTNPGPGSLDITGITLTGSFPGDFGQTSNCGTVPASGTCPINSSFRPTALGPRTADVSVNSTSVFSPTVAHLTGNGSIRQLPGFTTNALAANDDGSTGQVALPFSINFFGTTFSSLFVNNNGNVTFGQPLGDFTPSGLNTNNGGIPIIAPFWADVDTTGMGSSLVTYGNDTVNGHTAFGVNYQNVGYFASNFDKLNSFQVVLIDRSDTGAGNFDIEFNYDKIQWEVGDASRNDGGTGGLCGTLSLTDCTPAAVGYSNGTGNSGTNFQLAGSFVAGALLDGGPAGTSLIANDLSNSTLGRYLFSVRNGVVQGDTLTLTLAGAGTGTVKDNAGQLINCGDAAGGQRTCTATYPNGTQLILSATADTGSTFTGWSAPCSGTGTCAFTITQDTSVTATFASGTVTLQSITVAPPTPSIVAGTTQAFTATGHFSDGSTGPVTVTWSSGNTGIATIDATTGVATGVAAGGPITIKATSTQTPTISGTAQLTVTAPVVLVSIAVTPANPTVVVGQNQQFTATGTFSDKSTQDLTASVAWSSSNTEAASITEGGGLATGLTGGESTTIKATKAQGNTNIVGSTTLTVTTVPFVLTITPPPGGNPGAPPTVSPGGTLAIGLTLTAAPGFTGTVSFGCVSNQPQFLTCTPAPSSVTLSGNTPKQVAIVMNTFCQGETPVYGPGPGGFGGGLALLLAAAMLGSITWAYRTRSRWALSFAVLMLIALGSAACSSPPSGPSGRTPPGTYVLNITATAGGASQTVQQQIQVLP